MAFISWSKIKPEALKTLRPDLGLRSWNDISTENKDLIWKFFRNKTFFGEYGETHEAIFKLNENFKVLSPGKNLLAHGGPHHTRIVGSLTLLDCCKREAAEDFRRIVYGESEEVVYETVSYYAESLDSEMYEWFKETFNDIASQFGLNAFLNKQGFVLRQEKKITKEIYEPTLNLLAGDEKWNQANRELGDAFSDYLKKTGSGYSSCITHAISALQAFLQILVVGKTGKGEIAELIKKGQTSKVIPDDPFSRTIFKNIVSVLMQERQQKGDPHPKKEYADEKSARLTLNLVMVFIQHCLQ